MIVIFQIYMSKYIAKHKVGILLQTLFYLPE